MSRDGTSVSPASFGVPIPVDVGQHSVEATAAGHKPFTTTATVSKDGESVEVSVPKLEPEAAATPEPAATMTTATPSQAPPSADKGEGSGQRTIGFVIGGVGVAGLAAGAITGLMAMGKSSDAKATCPTDGACASRDAVDASESARTLGLVSTIALRRRWSRSRGRRSARVHRSERGRGQRDEDGARSRARADRAERRPCGRRRPVMGVF